MGRLAAAAVAAAILYGSLYPFSFRAAPAAPLEGLWTVAPLDVVINLLLYMPLGLALTLRARRVGVAVATGLLLSLAVETAQLWLPVRSTTLSDVVANGLGALVGALLGRAIARRRRRERPGDDGDDGGRGGGFPLLLAAAFLGWQATPFLPSAAPADWLAGLMPLASGPVVAGDLAAYGAAWLAVGLVVAGLTPQGPDHGRRVAARLLVLVGVVALAKVLVMTRSATPEVLAPGVLIAAAWRLEATRRFAAAPGVAATALAVTIAWSGLAGAWPPSGGAPFHWMPFTGALGGPLLPTVQVMLQKLFLYGALVLSLLRLGAPPVLTAGLAGSLLLGIEVVQAITGGRVAEITDPLIAVGLTVVAVRLAGGPTGWRAPGTGAVYSAAAPASARRRGSA